jgi:hypothetical protein
MQLQLLVIRCTGRLQWQLLGVERIERSRTRHLHDHWVPPVYMAEVEDARRNHDSSTLESCAASRLAWHYADWRATSCRVVLAISHYQDHVQNHRHSILRSIVLSYMI